MGECLKLVGADADSPSWADPCFYKVMDRFLTIAAEYKAPLSIYVIGKDLENPDYAAAVARWHKLGHEIGNHTYSHRQDLNRLSYEEIYQEISKAHDLIIKATGVAPKGFIAPGWSVNSDVTRVLIELNYLYDTSLAPSWMLPLQQLLLSIKSKGARKFIPLIRRDLFGNLFGPRKPYLLGPSSYLRQEATKNSDQLVMLPLPTSPLFRLALCHTLGFQLPVNLYRKVIRSTLNNLNSFYYLMHPADLICSESDLKDVPKSILNVWRMGVPLERKEALLRAALDEIQKHSRFVTMAELAKQFLASFPDKQNVKDENAIRVTGQNQ